MFQIINKRLNISSRWEKVYHIHPSGYIRKGALQVFHKIRRQYPSDYILCIGYDRGDTQFALTETFKTYENDIQEVVDRCLQEECSVERRQKEGLDVQIYNEKHATIYCVPFRATMDSLKPCMRPLAEETDTNQHDDKTRKLVLLLHGPENVLKHIFSQFYSVEKDITHLMIAPVQDIPKIFPKFFPTTVYSYPSFLNSHYYIVPSSVY